MARVFTRQSFHDLVWSKPVTQIAKEFALSDVAIHKICRKHAVPTPPLGWWAKKQAGKPVEQTPLPQAAKDISDRIVIAAPELGSETSTIATKREAARVRVSGTSIIKVGLQPLIQGTIAALRKAGPGSKGLLEVSGAALIRCEVGPGSIDRVETVLSSIAAAAAVQGFQLEASERGVHFAGDGETISIAMMETVQRVRHVLTPVEQKQQDAWDKKVERDRRRSAWSSEWELPPSFRQWDYVCTGQLGFEMESVSVGNRQGPRSTFRDAKVQRLDTMAEDISVALVVLAVAKREERERRVNAERIRLEEKRVREQPLRTAFVAERRRRN